MTHRQDWDDYFFDMAKLISTRSTCLRRQYGCVLVKDKHVVSSGFNGAPRGYPHCDVLGCAREGVESGTKHELCRAAHAEQNAIANAARYGISTNDSELYIYPGDMPCPICAKILINAGVYRIHYHSTDYPGWELSEDLFLSSGISLWKHEKPKEEYQDIAKPVYDLLLNHVIPPKGKTTLLNTDLHSVSFEIQNELRKLGYHK